MIASDYYRAVEVSQMRRLMRYGEQEFREDWAVAVALAQLMAISGDKGGQQRMLDMCFQRIYAYHANNPDILPWENPK